MFALACLPTFGVWLRSTGNAGASLPNLSLLVFALLFFGGFHSQSWTLARQLASFCCVTQVALVFGLGYSSRACASALWVQLRNTGHAGVSLAKLTLFVHI